MGTAIPTLTCPSNIVLNLGAALDLAFCASLSDISSDLLLSSAVFNILALICNWIIVIDLPNHRSGYAVSGSALLMQSLSEEGVIHLYEDALR